jgi:hypothetical protein
VAAVPGLRFGLSEQPPLLDSSNPVFYPFSQAPLPPPLPDHTLADTMYDRLRRQIREFEQSLGPDQEIGGKFIQFGQQNIISIEGLAYQNPHLIIFYGLDLKTGNRVRLVQHMSQVSVMFMAIPKPAERPEPRRIGFSKD